MNKCIGLVVAMLLVLIAVLPVRAETRFDAMDTNDDGYLSSEELEIAFPGRGNDAFTGMDTNGDGLLTHREWNQGHYALGLGQGVGGQGWGGQTQQDDGLILQGKGKGGQGKNSNQGILTW